MGFSLLFLSLCEEKSTKILNKRVTCSIRTSKMRRDFADDSSQFWRLKGQRDEKIPSICASISMQSLLLRWDLISMRSMLIHRLVLHSDIDSPIQLRSDDWRVWTMEVFSWKTMLDNDQGMCRASSTSTLTSWVHRRQSIFSYLQKKLHKQIPRTEIFMNTNRKGSFNQDYWNEAVAIPLLLRLRVLIDVQSV